MKRLLIFLSLSCLTTFGAADGINGEVITKVGTTGTVLLPGSQTTNTTIQMVSKVTDGASAVAFSLNSSNVLSTSGAKLLTVGNRGTNRNAISALGAQLGGNAFDSGDWSFDSDATSRIGAFYVGDENSVSRWGAFFGGYTNISNSEGSWFYTYGQGSDRSLTSEFVSGGPSYNNIIRFHSGPDSGFLEFRNQGGQILKIDPYAADGTTPNVLDTDKAHTSGNLLEIKNHTSAAVTFPFDGTIVLAGTTNQIVFGATNTEPSSAVAPTKWISVQVQGESATYRIPLYE